MLEFIFISAIIIWVVLAVFVWMDAIDRGHSGKLWFLITVITGVIGVLFYLVIRGEPGNKRTSQHSAPSNATATHLGARDRKLKTEVKQHKEANSTLRSSNSDNQSSESGNTSDKNGIKCKSCGEIWISAKAYCGDCGTKLEN